ncbi:uncharacterized protein LOC115449913 [Manduca sexta]|nr:uncharacterized protein LOC115449913 [Manduca sexta]
MLHAAIINFLLAIHVHISVQCPIDDLTDAKAAYKSGEVQQSTYPITLDKIKEKMRDAGIFDWQDRGLTDRERKELSKLMDAVEIMTTSRNRQPQNVQNMFSSLRMVERVVKKQLKEGQISETLAAKFNWDKISTRQKRGKPIYYLDKTTNMRMFNID